MFLGEYRHNLDSKGRLSVPKKFRERLASGAILTKGLDGCLFIYPKGEWNRLSRTLKRLPVTRSDARAFERYLFGSAVEADFDQLGRIKIPNYLLEYALLTKEVVLLGVLERVEIWSKDRWEKFAKILHTKGEKIAEELSKTGD